MTYIPPTSYAKLEKVSQESKEEKQEAPTPKPEYSEEFYRLMKASWSIFLMLVLGTFLIAGGASDNDMVFLAVIGAILNIWAIFIFPFRYICKLILRRTAKDNEN